MPLTVEQARSKRVCRICEKPILVPEASPDDWATAFGSRNFPPPRIVLAYGQEFAHQSCVSEEASKILESKMAEFPSRGRDEEGMKKKDTITQLGSGKKYDLVQSPQASLLEHFPNPNPDRAYTIKHETDEFTSLCPKTGQPDFASFKLHYIADQKCVESKSLKIYLFSYRNEGAFMEAICNRIGNDLIAVLDPQHLKIIMEFNARGGIRTSVDFDYWKQQPEMAADLCAMNEEIKRLGKAIDNPESKS